MLGAHLVLLTIFILRSHRLPTEYTSLSSITSSDGRIIGPSPLITINVKQACRIRLISRRVRIGSVDSKKLPVNNPDRINTRLRKDIFPTEKICFHAHFGHEMHYDIRG